MRLNLVATLRCDGPGCGRESEPFKVEVQIRPDVGVQFLPPVAPEGWTMNLDRKAEDPLCYFCPRCQRTASGARNVPVVASPAPEYVITETGATAERCPLRVEMEIDGALKMVRCESPKDHSGAHQVCPTIEHGTVHFGVDLARAGTRSETPGAPTPPPNPYDDEPDEGDEPT